MTSVNNNNGPNGDNHKKHNKNTGWIVGGSIAGGLAATGIAYGVYRHMNPPEPPSVVDTFVKDILPQAKGFVKPALGIGAVVGAGMLLKKAISRDLEVGEESFLGKIAGSLGLGRRHEDYPEDYHY